MSKWFNPSKPQHSRYDQSRTRDRPIDEQADPLPVDTSSHRSNSKTPSRGTNERSHQSKVSQGSGSSIRTFSRRSGSQDPPKHSVRSSLQTNVSAFDSALSTLPVREKPRSDVPSRRLTGSTRRSRSDLERDTIASAVNHEEAQGPAQPSTRVPGSVPKLDLSRARDLSPAQHVSPNTVLPETPLSRQEYQEEQAAQDIDSEASLRHSERILSPDHDMATFSAPSPPVSGALDERGLAAGPVTQSVDQVKETDLAMTLGAMDSSAYLSLDMMMAVEDIFDMDDQEIRTELAKVSLSLQSAYAEPPSSEQQRKIGQLNRIKAIIDQEISDRLSGAAFVAALTSGSLDWYNDSVDHITQEMKHDAPQSPQTSLTSKDTHASMSPRSRAQTEKKKFQKNKWIREGQSLGSNSIASRTAVDPLATIRPFDNSKFTVKKVVKPTKKWVDPLKQERPKAKPTSSFMLPVEKRPKKNTLPKDGTPSADESSLPPDQSSSTAASEQASPTVRGPDSSEPTPSDPDPEPEPESTPGKPSPPPTPPKSSPSHSPHSPQGRATGLVNISVGVHTSYAGAEVESARVRVQGEDTPRSAEDQECLSTRTDLVHRIDSTASPEENVVVLTETDNSEIAAATPEENPPTSSVPSEDRGVEIPSSPPAPDSSIEGSVCNESNIDLTRAMPAVSPSGVLSPTHGQRPVSPTETSREYDVSAEPGESGSNHGPEEFSMPDVTPSTAHLPDPESNKDLSVGAPKPPRAPVSENSTQGGTTDSVPGATSSPPNTSLSRDPSVITLDHEARHEKLLTLYPDADPEVLKRLAFTPEPDVEVSSTFTHSSAPSSRPVSSRSRPSSVASEDSNFALAAVGQSAEQLSRLQQLFPSVPIERLRRHLEMNNFDFACAKTQIYNMFVRRPRTESRDSAGSRPTSKSESGMAVPRPRPVATIDYKGMFPSFDCIFTSLGRSFNRKSSGTSDLSSRLSQTYETQRKMLELWKEDCPADADSEVQLWFKIVSSRPEVTHIVRSALADSDVWEEIPSDMDHVWNLLWTWSKPRIPWKDLLCWQRVNHFPHARELTRKDLLKKHLQRYSKIPGRQGAAFRIMPETFILPHEYLQFVDHFHKVQEEEPERPNIWIMKPVGLSRGRGIVLVDDVTSISYGDSVVIQQYVDRPLLLNGFKFDLRLYVLVTSFNPLEVFLYKEGFARLSTEKYTTSASSIGNQFIHLTNSSIQKHSASYSTGDSSSSTSSKWSLEQCRKTLTELGVDWNSLWTRIIAVVLKSLMCVSEAIPNHPNSFELFGYDVLIDEDLKPWLIEVNASPAMSMENQLDVKTKLPLIQDTINLIDPLHYNREVLLDLVSRRFSDRPRDRPLEGGDSFTKNLNSYLERILFGKIPRKHGEMPRNVGLYERIAPSRQADQIQRLFKLK